jgi:hypothetical protein
MAANPTEKPNTTMPAVVEKIIKPMPFSTEPEKAQLAVKGADHYYRELRIENSLTDQKGRTVGLKEGAEVDVIIEADPKDTTPKG